MPVFIVTQDSGLRAITARLMDSHIIPFLTSLSSYLSYKIRPI